jgi:epoxyqueuosine reductase
VADFDAPKYGTAFKDWLSEGAAGEMAYMTRGAEKRLDPGQVLPGARSVISLALNYWQGDAPVEPRHPPDGAAGRIARYAWGDDYHDLINDRLVEIDRFLQSHGGRQKCYVDTGPVLERDFAEQAGIGWHGKSTMLLDRALGTWFFLAEIFTTLELPPDSRQPDRCGTCVRCMAACPTGAISSPHRLDARLCISYLTIELKGPIPPELRPLIGDRIFGCDECLSACPWNRFAQKSRETVFAARPATVGMLLRDYLALSEEQFRLLFQKSPIKRVKRRGFLRNVCVALGNVGDSRDLPALERAATTEEELVAEHARWAAAEIRRRDDRPVESKTAPAASY